MAILDRLIPTLREVRGPLISGYIWLLTAWLAAKPGLDSRPQTFLDETRDDLATLVETIGSGGALVIVGVLAYLVGSLSTTAIEHFTTPPEGRAFSEESKALWSEWELRASLLLPLAALGILIVTRATLGADFIAFSASYVLPALEVFTLSLPILLFLEGRAKQRQAKQLPDLRHEPDPTQFADRYRSAAQLYSAPQTRMAGLHEFLSLAADSADRRPSIEKLMSSEATRILGETHQVQGFQNLPRTDQELFNSLATANNVSYVISNLDLTKRNLSGWILAGATLRNVDLTDADLSNADLSDLVIQSAILTKACLKGADLTNLQVREATPATGADIRGARLSGADTALLDLTSARWSDETTWPANFNASRATGNYSSGSA